MKCAVEDRTNRFGKFMGFAYPYFISLIVTALLFRVGFNYSFKGFDKILDAAITFSSIIVGFLGALLGILVSIKESKIVKAIFKTKEKFTLKYYFEEAFAIGIAVVILTCAMYVLINTNNKWSITIFYYLWLFTTILFIPSSYRIVSLLMAVFFNSNNEYSGGRPEGNDLNKDELEAAKEKLKKR
ncbi:MAG: hypothetical protein K0S47_4630 [Herbinix sp.]|nr:hypothetical protein [Herbinix sp.]MDF2789585.1 hypothetical protein [Neobacillus sp.]